MFRNVRSFRWDVFYELILGTPGMATSKQAFYSVSISSVSYNTDMQSVCVLFANISQEYVNYQFSEYFVIINALLCVCSPCAQVMK